MRKAVYAGAALLAVAVAPAALSTLIACAASMLLESAPFILAGAAALWLPLRWSARIVPYLSCGCGAGPSARSLPAAAATLLVFGPLVACARLAAAFAIERLRQRDSPCEHESRSILAQFFTLLPLAALAGLVSLGVPALLRAHLSGFPAFAIGAITAFILAPCALGAVGVASALRAVTPLAATGFLCVTGIVDARTWFRPRELRGEHDAFGYALAAIACVLVALRGGDDLVHPKIALALWPCAAAFAVLAVRFRSSKAPLLRIAPAVMIAGAVLSAPPPAYHATQTTLADAFAGERVDFTGVMTRTGGASALVRFAITCCRADAAPVVLRLANAPLALRGWVHASGVLIQASDGLRLRVERIEPVAPPSDPFIYR